MARPRSFSTDAVIDAAKHTFWERGYGATSIGDLEQSTGLNRSSLYQAFGSKRELFDAALARYVADNVDPVLAGMERLGAGRSELTQYFATLAAVLREDPQLAVRGCLIVNTMAELALHGPEARAAAAAYRCRVIAALTNALRGAADGDEQLLANCDQRARTLCAAVMGALVTAHVDPADAANLCEDLAATI